MLGTVVRKGRGKGEGGEVQRDHELMRRRLQHRVHSLVEVPITLDSRLADFDFRGVNHLVQQETHQLLFFLHIRPLQHPHTIT
jgi:hypothetical protein